MKTCIHCNKPLTDPISVKRGIGPDCWRARIQADRNRTGNLFSNQANYSWGLDGTILWLKDEGGEGRSLTNDMENALARIQAELDDKPISDYTIIYRDSEGVWDQITLTKFNLEAVFIDFQWLSDSRFPNYWSQGLDVDFHYVGETSYEAAKTKVLSRQT